MLAIAEGFGESPVAALLEPNIDPVEMLSQPPVPPHVPPAVARRLRLPDLKDRARLIRQQSEKLGMQVLTPAHHDWPQRLSEQPVSPLALFSKGDPQTLGQEPACAVVGSRTPTPYGIDTASNLCSALARADVVLWSGLARGIDGIAHEACVRANTPTVAVLAGGLDQIYPAEHALLCDRILATGGCIISELPPGRRARRGHFVRRNRLLGAGPSAVIVVEGSLVSGALHTARFASDCSTDVFAVPGPWQSERSQGCHRLIAEGAGIIESPETLMQSLGLVAKSGADARRLELSREHQAILTLLQAGPRPTDVLRRESGLSKETFLRTLLKLDQLRHVQRLPGDLWRQGDL